MPLNTSKSTINTSVIDYIKQKNAGITRQNNLSRIAGKMSAGKRLNPSEMQYLRKTDPVMYGRAAAVEAERRAYIRRLKNCRTKDEVRQLNVSKSMQHVSEADAAGKSRSSKQLETAHMRSMAQREEHGAFVQTREYRNLPENILEAKRKGKKRSARSRKRGIDILI